MKTTVQERPPTRPSLWLSLLCLSALPASAQLYWDSNGSVTGAGATPTGAWGTDGFWSDNEFGEAATGAWVPGSLAVFSAGLDASGPFTVTINGTQTTSGVNIEEGIVTFTTGTAAVGTGAITIASSAMLSINLSTRISGTAGSARLVLDGGTIQQTNPGNAGSFIPASIFLEVGPNGGTVNYSSSAPTVGLVSIYGGASGGTIIGTGVLTKNGPGEFRYQGVGLPNTTYSKLVVNEGLFRLGFNSSISDERGFGAVPAVFTPDAITLANGGSIGTSFAAANSVLHPNRGITLGDEGGAITGTMTIPGAITGSGSLSHLTTGTLVLNGNSDYTGSTIVTAGIVTVGNANALGSVSGNTQVSGAGEIRFDGAATNFTVNEPFQIAGTGTTNGAMFIQNGARPTISGPVTLSGDALVGVSGTAAVTFNHAAAFTSLANQSLTLQGGTISTGGGGTISGAISLGAGGLTKLQGGTWTLGGANSWTGATTISSGSLIVNGSIVGTSVVNVTGPIGGSATLGGTGTITPASGGNINILALGKLSPGPGLGNLTAALSGGAELDISAGISATNSQALLFDLDTVASSDRITITGGALEIGSAMLEFDDFTFTTLGGFAEGDYLLFDGDTAISGSLGALTSGLLGTYLADLQLADGGNDLVLHVVPEPGSAVLLLGGISLLASRRRRS
jgi:autotransporter-associated beta strand protein